MANYPKVSIVVPTYNREDYLKECLDSIIDQNYPNLEIVVTNDNSMDNTKNIVKKYIKQYSFIKYVKNTKYPQGPNGNKNNGLDNATGEIIGIFDDDDTMVKGALKMMVDKILEGYDLVMGNCKIVSNGNNNGKLSGRGLNSSGEIDWLDNLCGKISGEYWSIFRKDFIGEKRFDMDIYGGEGTLWRGLMKNKKIYYIHKAVRNYRINESSVTHNMIHKANIVIKNYERDIEYYGEEMKRYCPCYLATIYKGASYFAKLSNQYTKGFRYIFKSIKLCPSYKASYVMILVMIIPKKIVLLLTKLRVKLKND